MYLMENKDANEYIHNSIYWGSEASFWGKKISLTDEPCIQRFIAYNFYQCVTVRYIGSCPWLLKLNW